MKIQALKEDLISKGLCEKWADEQRWPAHADVDYVVRNVAMSMDGMDFIASKNYPTPSMLIRIGGKSLDKYNLFVKKMTQVTLSVGQVKSHFVGCTCDVIIPDGFVGYVYASSGSNLNIIAGSHCDVRLSTYGDNTVVTANYEPTSKVVWTKHDESKFTKL